MRNQRVSSEHREELLAEFERSGLNAAAFARQHRINYSTFRYWHKRAAQSPISQRPTLVEVVQDRPSDGRLEIRLGKLCRIEIGHRELEVAVC